MPLQPVAENSLGGKPARGVHVLDERQCDLPHVRGTLQTMRAAMGMALKDERHHHQQRQQDSEQDDRVDLPELTTHRDAS